MAITLRLTDDEHEALRRRAADDGVSMQHAARQAIRDYTARAEHRQRVDAAASAVIERHDDALRRLGE